MLSIKECWNLVKITLLKLLKDQRTITDEPTLCLLFNYHYINIAQNSCGKRPTSSVENIALVYDNDVVGHILYTERKYPSILAMNKKHGYSVRILFIKRGQY